MLGFQFNWTACEEDMAESEAVARDLQPGAIAIVDSPSIRTSAVCPLTPIRWGWCGRTSALEQFGWEFMFVLPSFATRTVYFTFQQLKTILEMFWRLGNH